MTTMHNPPHPGETLREDVLPALGLTVTEAAAQLGVTRAALSRVLNGRAAISPEMALRLEGWLGVENGGRDGRRIGRTEPVDNAHAGAAGAIPAPPKGIRESCRVALQRVGGLGARAPVFGHSAVGQGTDRGKLTALSFQ